jgi:hypothetical protein
MGASPDINCAGCSRPHYQPQPGAYDKLPQQVRGQLTGKLCERCAQTLERSGYNATTLTALASFLNGLSPTIPNTY